MNFCLSGPRLSDTPRIRLPHSKDPVHYSHAQPHRPTPNTTTTTATLLWVTRTRQHAEICPTGQRCHCRQQVSPSSDSRLVPESLTNIQTMCRRLLVFHIFISQKHLRVKRFQTHSHPSGLQAPAAAASSQSNSALLCAELVLKVSRVIT